MGATSATIFIVLFVLQLLILGVYGLVQEDRVSGLVQVVHAGWKTPWLEMSLSEMPRFMLNEAVLLHPMFPKKDENDKGYVWKPDMDAKISFTFSESKTAAPSILLYSKEGKTLEKIVFTFEHDGFNLLSVSHTETYRDVEGRSMPDLSKEHHPPIDVEYLWKSVQEDDLNLGVKVMFMTTVFMTMGLTWVIIVSYDRDSVHYSSAPLNRNGIGRGRKSSTTYSSGGAGITINKRR